jgi:hypothetical protein
VLCLAFVGWLGEVSDRLRFSLVLVCVVACWGNPYVAYSAGGMCELNGGLQVPDLQVVPMISAGCSWCSHQPSFMDLLHVLGYVQVLVGGPGALAIAVLTLAGKMVSGRQLLSFVGRATLAVSGCVNVLHPSPPPQPA